MTSDFICHFVIFLSPPSLHSPTLTVIMSMLYVVYFVIVYFGVEVYMCKFSLLFTYTVKPVLKGHLWDKEKMAL
jgi:hypothetical protein